MARAQRFNQFLHDEPNDFIPRLEFPIIAIGALLLAERDSLRLGFVEQSAVLGGARANPALLEREREDVAARPPDRIASVPACFERLSG